jgi:hypothetical protein
LKEFVDTVKNNTSTSIQKRAALWAIGHIGSTAGGFALLEEGDIVRYISDQANNCSTLSMRGTCFYILGLLSRTTRAREVLAKMNWDFSPNPQAGIVIPTNVAHFLKVASTSFSGAWASDKNNHIGLSKVPGKGKAKDDGGMDEGTGNNPGNASVNVLESKGEKDNVGNLILGHISNLCNHVTQKGSLQSLRTLRGQYKDVFTSTHLLFETMKMLASYTYRLPALRFILFDLFNIVEFNAQSMAAFDLKFNSETNEETLLKLLAPLVKHPPSDS